MEQRKNASGLEENILRQELIEAASLPVHGMKSGISNPHGSVDKHRILATLSLTIVLLSLIGFTASNWMLRQQMGELDGRVRQAETRMNAMARMEAGRHASGVSAAKQSATEYHAIALEIKQLKTRTQDIKPLQEQALEIRRSIVALEHSVVEIKRSVAAQAEFLAQKKKAPFQQTKISSRDVEKPVTVVAEKPRIKKKKGRGGWIVNLIILANEKSADRELEKLRKGGIQAEKHPIRMRGKVMYQLRAGGFSGMADARAFIRDIAARVGYKDAWLVSE